jgi:hypothetical protein
VGSDEATFPATHTAAIIRVKSEQRMNERAARAIVMLEEHDQLTPWVSAAATA